MYHYFLSKDEIWYNFKKQYCDFDVDYIINI